MSTEIPTIEQLLCPDGPACLTLIAKLSPIGGTDRFQPAGFPEVGHVIYDAPRVDKDGRVTKEKVCIVDSSASMANHLESVCLADAGSLDLHANLDNLPYVVCETDDCISIANGEVTANNNERTGVVSTFTEGHRIASDYFLDAILVQDGKEDSAETFRQVLRRDFGIVEVKKDKTYFIPPSAWWNIYRTLFNRDPNSLIHGVLFAKEQIKISRVLSAHMEAFGANRVGSAGVKFDRLQKTTSGQPIFAKDEETAERIQATCILDLGLLRSFGRGDKGLNATQKTLLLSFALWKVARLLLQPFRYRSECFLKCDSLSLATDGVDITLNTDNAKGDEPCPFVTWLKAINIGAAITACNFHANASPSRVYYGASQLYKAGKDDESSDDNDHSS